MNIFTRFDFGFRPFQSVNSLIIRLQQVTETFVRPAVAFQWTIIDFVFSFNMEHQVFGGISRIHQHGAKRQFFMFDGVIRHLSNMVEFGFTVHIGSEQAIIYQPKLIGFRIDINARDDADAFDYRFGIARILAAHKFYLKRVIFIGSRVVKEQITVFAGNYRIFDLFPNKMRFEFLIPQVTVQLNRD